MTSGEPPTSPSAAKIGGFALIGVGALAAVLGVSALVSGGSDDAAAPPVDQQQTSEPLPPLPPAPSSSAPAPSTPEPPPSADEPPAPAPDPEPQAPPANQPRPDAPGAGQGEHGRPKIVVRVYNNSTIKGLAHRAADDFRSVGYDVPEVGNYARGTIPTTTVYYRPGTPEQAQAEEVAAAFQARTAPRFEGLDDASPGVIAIITNDYKGLGKGGK